jgi:hypothetical protein
VTATPSDAGEEGREGEGTDGPRDGEFDDWLDAVAAGEGFYLEGPEGHGCLPPRRVCPHTGSPDLRRRPLPDEGAVESFTVVHVAPPAFVDETPYVTAIARFGPVKLTGVVRDAEPEAVRIGDAVRPGVVEVGGTRTLALTPAGTAGAREPDRDPDPDPDRGAERSRN